MTYKNEILNQAVDAFRKETGMNLEITGQEVTRGDAQIDAILSIDLQGETLECWAKVKATVTNIKAGRITHQFNDNFSKWILITRFVQPQIAGTLRELNIQFMDTAGNAYINNPPVYIFIHGNKPQPDFLPMKEEGMLGRAGIQVIFALLCSRTLCNAPYRHIADQAQVALGAVAKVIREIKARGFLVETADKKRRLIQKKELLDKWLTAYEEKVRPKKLMGKFTCIKPDFWQHEDMDRFNAQWGGEVAAFRLTHNLKPETITIYTQKPIHDLTLGLRFRMNRDGDVELRERFWKFVNEDLNEPIVPPLLIYADLMATGEARNIETAGQIYHDYLQKEFDQD